MIIVSGLLADDPIRLLVEQLIRQNEPFLFLNELEYPARFTVRQTWEPDGRVSGYINGPDQRHVDFADVSGVYIRFADFESSDFLKDFDEWEREAIRAERNFSQSFMFDDLNCAVVNRFTSQLSNSCKPLQSAIASRYGFPTPRTLMTSDPAAARDFVELCEGAVIYKAMGGMRSIVDRIAAHDLDRLDDVRTCPVMFQEFIDGPNVRVHVVGSIPFVTRIHASAVDYRYSATRFETVKLPPHVEDACVKLTRDLDLLMSGIDLIENDGRYWFLEANPSPGYSFFEVNAKQPISAALAELLRTGDATILPKD